MTKMIGKNTTIPTKHAQVFSTADDNQPAVTIKVYQGEREMASGNKLLGEFNLEGIPPSPRGTPQIEVSFDIDANGILHVGARTRPPARKPDHHQGELGPVGRRDPAHGQGRRGQRRGRQEGRELADARNGADALIHSTRKAVTEYGDKLEAGEKEKIEAAVRNWKMRCAAATRPTSRPRSTPCRKPARSWARRSTPTCRPRPAKAPRPVRPARSSSAAAGRQRRGCRVQGSQRQEVNRTAGAARAGRPAVTRPDAGRRTSDQAGDRRRMPRSAFAIRPVRASCAPGHSGKQPPWQNVTITKCSGWVRTRATKRSRSPIASSR